MKIGKCRVLSIDRTATEARGEIQQKHNRGAQSAGTMNCATMVSDDRFIYEKDRSTDRRTSRGLASCLRGESEEYYDYEAEGKLMVFTTVFISLYF